MTDPMDNVQPLRDLENLDLDNDPGEVCEDTLENGTSWGFRLTTAGVEWRDDHGDEPEWRWLCDPLEVAANTRDAGSENWGRLLVFEDRDGVTHEWAAAAADLARTQSGEVIVHLARLGFIPPATAKGKSMLIQYILTAQPKARLRVVGRVGWEGAAFVLPDTSFGGTDDERIWFQIEGAPVEHSYRVAGTLQDWQEKIGLPCIGNTRLAFATSCAFAGPLLNLLGEESGGFHLRGASSVGKSTALKVAASVWGGGGVSGFIRNWRATDNGLEGVAVQHCDTFLPLDELGQIDGRAAAASAYMLANGQGKARAGKTGAARKAATWRVLFLSTGEISLGVKIAEDGFGKKAKAGQEVRVLDVPADPGAGLGLFDRVPDGMDGAAFAAKLGLAASETYGTPARAYIDWLCSDASRAVIAAKRVQESVLDDLVPEGADGQVRRATRRFALVAAAGELATHAGITDWPEGEACRATTACFQNWLEARGGSEASEVRDGIEHVRLFIEKHGASRFQDWDASSTVVPNRAGFTKTGADGERIYCILPAVWKSEVCQGRDAKAVAVAMAERGMLEPDPSGKMARAFTVPALGQSKRLYWITSHIFEGENDG